jgi:chromosome segregation ATPase
MGEISLDMIWKRLEDLQSGQEAIRAELVHTNEKLGAVAQTLIGVQRDIRSLQREVATLGVAVDEHTRRLDGIEKRLGLMPAE